MEDTWQKTGDNAKLPQFAYGNANKASSRWLMSTDHLRVKNMTLDSLYLKVGRLKPV
jgi:hypothetical protein